MIAEVLKKHGGAEKIVGLVIHNQDVAAPAFSSVGVVGCMTIPHGESLIRSESMLP